MHVYLVFVPSICTGDGNGDEVLGIKTGGPFGIGDPFVYKKVYPCVWLIQVNKVEILAARMVCSIDGAVFLWFLDSNQVEFLYPLVSEQTCHNLVL